MFQNMSFLMFIGSVLTISIISTWFTYISKFYGWSQRVGGPCIVLSIILSHLQLPTIKYSPEPITYYQKSLKLYPTTE